MPQVVFDESRHEMVAMVVARLKAQVQRDLGGRASLLEQIGTQLGDEERVGLALVHQDGRA